VAALTAALVGGCASPGPPLPPTLKLPQVVDNLTAVREGDAVTLRWTTPTRTTDKLSITEPITAEVCREAVASAASGQPANGAKSATPGGKACAPVLTVQVKSGASEAVDQLPAALTAASAGLVAYRVQLRNAEGHTAGPSAATFVASGPAPAPVEGLHGTATKAGVLLQWMPGATEPVAARNGGVADVVEVERTAVDGAAGADGSSPSTAAAGGGAERRKGGLMGAPNEPAESRFRVGVLESGEWKDGGAIDHTAQIGHTYRYTAQRVRTVELGGQTLEVRSAESDAVTVEMRDVFPPNVPSGLVAVPGFAAVSDGVQTQRPTIDLSWQPDMEARVAGYRVYRRDLGGVSPEVWRRVGPEAVTVPAYRDVSVVAGQRYSYRVTAVSEAGNESAPSGEVVESAVGP
jgi:hypothetical protein